MAWPFTTPASAPTSFAGPGAAVPTSPTEIGGGVAVALLGAHFTNQAAVSRTVTLTNTAGTLLASIEIPPGVEHPYEWPFRPSVGLKWSASGANVVGHVWGY